MRPLNRDVGRRALSAAWQLSEIVNGFGAGEVSGLVLEVVVEVAVVDRAPR